jgi:hypothetical protein
MRYWAYLAGKLVVAAGPLYALLKYLLRQFPEPPKATSLGTITQQTLQCDLLLFGWFLLSAGIIYVIVWDQRRRCRVCLRHLRMPVETGSWGSMLRLGRPRIEYICPYGHGTLSEEELQISGLANPEWTGNSGDIWEELTASARKAGKDL